MGVKVQVISFDGCPGHAPARALVAAVVAELAPSVVVEEVDASDAAVAARLRFPGSPTVRVDGVDVDPGYVDTGDYSPRCRVYRTPSGLAPVPPRGWVEDAVRRAAARG